MSYRLISVLSLRIAKGRTKIHHCHWPQETIYLKQTFLIMEFRRRRGRVKGVTRTFHFFQAILGNGLAHSTKKRDYRTVISYSLRIEDWANILEKIMGLRSVRPFFFSFSRFTEPYNHADQKAALVLAFRPENLLSSYDQICIFWMSLGHAWSSDDNSWHPFLSMFTITYEYSHFMDEKT